VILRVFDQEKAVEFYSKLGKEEEELDNEIVVSW